MAHDDELDELDELSELDELDPREAVLRMRERIERRRRVRAEVSTPLHDVVSQLLALFVETRKR